MKFYTVGTFNNKPAKYELYLSEISEESPFMKARVELQIYYLQSATMQFANNVMTIMQESLALRVSSGYKRPFFRSLNEPSTLYRENLELSADLLGIELPKKTLQSLDRKLQKTFEKQYDESRIPNSNWKV